MYAESLGTTDKRVAEDEEKTGECVHGEDVARAFILTSSASLQLSSKAED